MFCKSKKVFIFGGKFDDEKKIKNFLPLGGGGVEGCHSSPPFLFAKKLRKGGLFLRTFFRIKIYPAVQKLLASQGF